MYLYPYLYLHLYLYLSMYMCMYKYMYMYLYLYMYQYRHMYMYMNMYTQLILHQSYLYLSAYVCSSSSASSPEHVLIPHIRCDPPQTPLQTQAIPQSKSTLEMQAVRMRIIQIPKLCDFPFPGEAHPSNIESQPGSAPTVLDSLSRLWGCKA